MKKQFNLESFCVDNQFEFKNMALLERALTHSSFVNEQKCEERDNERLEFLGDAVLELAMSQFLFENFKDAKEGELSKLRAQHVCESALVVYAQGINLGNYLRLGKGEELSGGRERPAILADAFEALLGALFLDAGYQEAYKFLDRVVFELLRNGIVIDIKDYKSKLQELVQADSSRSISYKTVSESGPAHNRLFEVEVLMDEIVMGSGAGRSKKEAEQNAAKMALDKVAKVSLDKEKLES
jgi:ribonuclease III